MLSQLLTTPITITQRSPDGDRDAYGNADDDETTIEVLGEVQQRERTEDATGEVSDTSWLLILPADTHVAADSTITAAGLRYEVIGDPWTVRNPRTGQAHHIEATLRRTAGADTSS